MNHPATDKLCLHLHEELFWNDRFVVALDVVLRNGAVVLDPLFCQKVCGICFLKKGVTHVLLVAENLVDGAGVPFCLASAGEDAVSHEPVSDLIHAGAFEVFSVDPFYDFCLLRINDQVPKYYVEGSHEAIIDRDVFIRAQAEIDRRANIIKGG